MSIIQGGRGASPCPAAPAAGLLPYVRRGRARVFNDAAWRVGPAPNPPAAPRCWKPPVPVLADCLPVTSLEFSIARRVVDRLCRGGVRAAVLETLGRRPCGSTLLPTRVPLMLPEFVPTYRPVALLAGEQTPERPVTFCGVSLRDFGESLIPKRYEMFRKIRFESFCGLSSCFAKVVKTMVYLRKRYICPDLRFCVLRARPQLFQIQTPY